MIEESRRRAYLDAMQVTTWLPRVALPFAAPSRPALLARPPIVADHPAPAARAVGERGVAAPNRPATANSPPTEAAPVEPRSLATQSTAAQSTAAQADETRSGTAPAAAARPALDALRSAPKPVETPVEDTPQAAAPVRVAPPRFALQLLRAGACLLLVELPTGEGFQSRDPAYLLLKDLLRAAGLPDSPQLLGEPVRWPLLAGGNLDQGPEAARDFVQGFLAARMEEAPCACLWLVGLPAIRYASEADADAYDREVPVDGLGVAWALPGLETLMDEPARKASLWHAMRRVRRRWLMESVAGPDADKGPA